MKKYLGGLFALVLVLAFLIQPAAFAAEQELSGRCGAFAYWHLKGDTLVVGGLGSVASFLQSPADPHYTIDEKWQVPYAGNGKLPWDAFKMQIKNIYIEEGITDIFDNDFNLYSKLEYLYLPSSIKDLGYAAFRRSDNLRQVHYAGAKGTLNIGKSTQSNIKRAKLYYDSAKEPPFETGFAQKAKQAMKDTFVTGAAGENIRWVLKEQVLYVYGEGKMRGRNESGTAYIDPIINHPYGERGPSYLAPWAEYGNIIEEVRIDEGVTGLFTNAFSECKNLHTLQLPKSIDSIETNSIAMASNLNVINYLGNGTEFEAIHFFGPEDKERILQNQLYFETTPETIVKEDYETLSGEGWIYKDGHWSYQKEDGKLATGWQEIKGFWWNFNEKGIWQAQMYNKKPN